jgi:transposase InsO family protein
MPWKIRNIMDEKKEFINELLNKELSIKCLCEKYEVSEKTGHKWKNRFMQYGLIGLEELSRKPISSPEKLEEDVIISLIKLRTAHPSWGAKKIQALFAKYNSHLNTPSISSIFRVLDKAKLIKKQKIKKITTDKTNQLRNMIKPKSPNDVWTVDFKGYWFSDGQKCLPLTIRDLESRKILNITLCPDGTCTTVRSVFEKVFRQYGLPKVIRSDNGTPFATKSAPLGLSKLSSWFLSLGIMVDRITPGKPGQNGSHERMHADLARDIEKHIPGGVKTNQIAIDDWVIEYNSLRPHEALGMKTPDEIYYKSDTKYEIFDITEYPIGFHNRKVKKNGSISLGGSLYFLSEALTGFDVGLQETKVSSEVKVWLNKFPLFILDLEVNRIKLIERGNIDIGNLPMS